MNRYTLPSVEPAIVFHTEEDRRYVLTIRDMPAEEKPRERLLKNGPAALSVPELVAIILGNGTRKEDVMSMSRRILKEYGDRTFKSLTDPKRSAHELGIPLVKAMQLVACSELGRRYFSRRSGSLPVVRTAAEAFEQLKDMASLNREHLRGLYLNSHYQVIHDEVVSIGTVDVNITHPREVFRPALEYGAAAVIIAHNHPSGMLKPSDQDIAVTEQLVEAGKVLGIRLLDHLIISADGFASVPADYSL